MRPPVASVRMIIVGRTLGTKKPLFEDFFVPVPPGGGGGEFGEGFTLRKLIERFVRHEVERYNDRRESSRFVRALTERQIADGETRGKIDPGGREMLAKAADPDAAVHAAIEAFEDGLYLVIVDGDEQRDLDARLTVTDETRVTFVRLVMLAGA